MVEEKIKTLLEKLFENDEEFQHCFLVDMHLGINKKLEVFVDSDTGIKFSECQKISRYLEGFIDEEGWLGEKYVLEVSSPGIDKPLQLARQYPKNVGRRMKVTYGESINTEGKLVEVSEEGIILEDKVREKEGKKKVTKTVRTEIPFSDIRKAVVKISFN